MTVELHALRFAAREPAVARFWADLLGREMVHLGDGRVELPPLDPSGLRLAFVPTTEAKQVQNHMHPDLTSVSVADQRAVVERALSLGGRPCDVGQTGDEPHVVLADPEGNELCVIEPGNTFLDGTGQVGAVAGDGTRECGLFWAETLGWPLVWDHDEETAIQSPEGGPKLTWGGPPLMPDDGQDRVRFEIRLAGDSGLEAELERLRRLGATLVSEHGDERTLTDPDGHAFTLMGGVTRGSAAASRVGP